MTKIGRRGFLGGAGLLAGVAAGCGTRRDPYAHDKPAVPTRYGLRQGSETQVFSTCGLCSAGCGIRVRVVEGRAVKVEGNPDSPINRGGLCPRGQAAIELLYHPSRVRAPMRRMGDRGGNRWQPVSWEEAVSTIAAELAKLRVAGEPRSLLLLDGEQSGTTHRLWARFMRAYGSPNHVGHGATGWGAAAQVLRTMTGQSRLPGYDFAGAKSILLVGTGALESSSQWIHLARALASGNQPAIWCASPRLPVSAAVVDTWLPVSPGESATLLFALAHVLLRDGLADESGLEEAQGAGTSDKSCAESWPDLRERIIAEHAPGKAAAKIGLDESRIEGLAHALASAQPALVAVDEDLADPFAMAAGLVVNALLSNLGKPGGVLLDLRPDPDVPVDDALDEVARTGLASAPLDGRASPGFESSRVLALPEALRTGKPYSAKALFLSHSNPAFSEPGRRSWLDAMAEVPFVVSFSPILDESVLHADWVLPDHTFLEEWDLVAPARAARVLSLRQPVVEPVFSTMATSDVVLRLAHALGGGVAKALPWDNPRDAALALAFGRDKKADDFLAEIESKGVGLLPESDVPPPAARIHAMWNAASSTPNRAEDPSLFPFVLYPYRGAAYMEGGVRPLPWLRELPLATGNPWKERIEMSREDADRLGIDDGDSVLLESPLAAVEVLVEVRTGIRSGVLALPLGGGPDPEDDSSPRTSQLWASSTGEPCGQWLACATRTRIRKLG